MLWYIIASVFEYDSLGGTMDKDFIKKALKDLASLYAIPSYEDSVKNYIMKNLKGTRAKMEVNNLGCLIVEFEGKNPKKGKVMLDAHMDEVGFVVQYVDKNGFLRIVAYGNIDARVVPSQKLVVHSSNGKTFDGVVGMLPPHVTAGKEATVIPLDQLYVDCGFKSDSEVEKAGIRVGSMVTFPANFTELMNGRFSSKALDNRVACAVLLGLAKHLHNTITERNIVLSFSVQEEGGLKGIASVVQKVKPEYALVVECTTACDVPGVSDEKKVAKMGAGIAFTVADNTGYILPQTVEHLIKTAKSKKIKHQIKTPRFGGTNAGALYGAYEGVKTGIAAVPSRYIHSPVSVCEWSDVFAMFDFVKAYSKSL